MTGVLESPARWDADLHERATVLLEASGLGTFAERLERQGYGVAFSTEDVQQAISEDRLSKFSMSDIQKAYDDSVRKGELRPRSEPPYWWWQKFHIELTAWHAVNRTTLPIVRRCDGSRFGSWTLKDGGHRALAAIFRGDEEILCTEECYDEAAKMWRPCAHWGK